MLAFIIHTWDSVCYCMYIRAAGDRRMRVGLIRQTVAVVVDVTPRRASERKRGRGTEGENISSTR